MGVVEGGFSDNPNDNGGATNHGISLRFLRGLVTQSDKYRSKYGQMPNADTIKRLTKDEAAEIYREEFWDRHRCGELPWPAAMMFFSYVVNMSPKNAGRILQKAINYSLPGTPLVVDGIVGNGTIAAAKRCQPAELCKRMDSCASLFYARLDDQHPAFSQGWQYRSADVLWNAAINKDE